MRSVSSETNGYPAAELKKWAARANTWAGGGDPRDLPHTGEVMRDGPPRDVFVYFISAAKERNPSAAVALARLAGRA
jgi:uncharacterized protein YecE (DUF72 family)